MDKQSGSENKQLGIASIIEKVSEINDQTDPCQTESQNINTQGQSFSQNMDQLGIEDSLDEVNKVTGNSNQTIEFRFYLTNSRGTQLAELEEQLTRADIKIEEQQQELKKIEESNQELEKYIDHHVTKTENELIEKQKLSNNRLDVVQEQTAAVWESFESLQERRNESDEFYNNVILKLDEEIKNLTQQFHDQVSNGDKELSEQLFLKDKQIFHFRMKFQQLQYQSTQLTQNINELDNKKEKLEKMIHEIQQTREDMKTKNENILIDIEARLNAERERESQLLAVGKENSKRYEELLAEYESAQAKRKTRENRRQNLKSNIKELEIKQKDYESKIDETKSKNLGIISERDLELSEYRKQLEDLEFANTEASNKSNEINSNNEKLSDTIAKSVQFGGELRRDVAKKDDEIAKQRDDFKNALKENEELSARSQSLDKELIAQKKLISQIKSNLNNCDHENDQSGKRESELRARLAEAKEKLKKKRGDVEQLRQDMSNEKLKSSEELIKFKEVIEQKNKQVNDLRKIRENLVKEEERINSERSKKLQQLTHSTIQCQRAGHEERIKQQIMEIKISRQEISAEILKHKQEGIQNAEKDRKEKEKRETDSKKMESKIETIEKLIAESMKQQENIKKTLKNIQTHDDEPKSTNIVENMNSSRLEGIMYGRHQSIPTASTPNNSPRQGSSTRIQFDFDCSDLSSINGSDIFEAADRHYAEQLRNNVTDDAKFA